MRSSIQKLVPSVLAACGAAVLVPGVALAQVPTPGQVGDTLKRPPELKPQPQAPVVTPQRSEPSPAVTNGKKIAVSRFEFAGNTLYSGEQLSSLVSEYAGREVTLLQIYEAADKVAEFYARNGYGLASVNVPPQKIEGGVVRLLISEGRISRIAAEGNESYSREQLARYLGEVRPGTIYRGSNLEQGIRVLNTLPGLQARAIVRPGERYGTTDVVIKAVEDPIAGALIVDNYGRENIGEFRFSGFITFNNPFGVEDQLQLLALRSEDGLLTYGYGAYSLPVSFAGTRLTMSYGHADFEVLGAPVDGKNRSGKIQIDHPMWQRPGSSLTVNGGVSRTRSNADFSGMLFSGTSITLLELGGTYNHTYQNLAVTQVTTTISSNFDELTRADIATATGVIDGDQRLRWEVDVQHLHPIANHLMLFARANGVYSPDPLVDTQQFSLGGPNSVRGYPASEVRGDRGYFGTIGLRRPFRIGAVSLLGRVFADSGKAFIVDPAPGTNKSDSLSSVGLGADIQYERLSFKFDWAFPRDNHPVSDGRDDSRLFGSMSVNF